MIASIFKLVSGVAFLVVFLVAQESGAALPVCGSENALLGANCRYEDKSSKVDADLENNQRISIYLHPATLLPTGLVFVDDGFFGGTYAIYVTAEFPLSKSNSLIINPSLYAGEFFRIGSGVGIRNFLGKKADGLYLQVMPSLYHGCNYGTFILYSIGSESCDDISFDILGYIGHSAKFSSFSSFFDFGIGYRHSSGKHIPIAFDINFGIGMPF